MNSAELRKTVEGWLNEIKQWHPASEQNWSDYISGESNTVDNQYEVQYTLFTESHIYVIRAQNDYLGCMAQSRKMRAGENWYRGNDLPDGPFNRETFSKIVFAMLGYELKAKTKS